MICLTRNCEAWRVIALISMKGHWWTHMSLSIIFYQPETKGFRSCDRKLSPPTDSKSLWLPALLESESCSVVSDSLQPPYSPWNSPGQNTGVGSRSLLQGIFPTQGLNPGLLHCRQILYQLSHQGSPRILECSLFLLQWIFPTQELNQGLLHCRRFFNSWATGKTQEYWAFLSLLQGIFPIQET